MEERKELNDHNKDRPFSNGTNFDYASWSSTVGKDGHHVQQGTFGETECDQVNIEGIDRIPIVLSSSIY